MQKTSPVLRKEVYQVIVTIVNSKFFTARAAQKLLTPLIGIVIIVRAGAAEWGGGSPCGRPRELSPSSAMARLSQSSDFAQGRFNVSKNTILHMQQVDQPERNYQKDAQTDHGNDRIDERSAHQAAAQP